MKKLGVILFAIMIVGILVWVNLQSILNCVSLLQSGITFGKRDTSSAVHIDNCFHEVYRDGEYTYYRCDLVVNNHRDEVKTISIKGILMADYLVGLIKTPFLELVDSNYELYSITLLPEESRAYEDILFRVKHRTEDSISLKYDRRMPWIILE